MEADEITFTFSSPDTARITHFCIYGRNPKWRWWKFWEKKTVFYHSPIQIDYCIKPDADYTGLAVEEKYDHGS